MDGEGNSKKFCDDRVVQEINKLISLNDEDTKKNNVILNKVVNDIIDVMKLQDDFFREHYKKIMFVGSFYKKTKVGKPEEFDLDLIIQLRDTHNSFERDLPGYTKLKVSKDCYKPEWQKYSQLLSKWVTEEGYLKQDVFRQWVERLFTNSTPKLATKDYKLRVKKSGPAFTLIVEQPGGMEMSVDLVPVLEFKNPPPLPGNFKEATWLAVPKPLKTDQVKPHNYWRMSFYHFEKNILKRHGYLKPVIRQVKKLRDRYDWKIIASYHIETLFLHELRAIEETSDSQKFNSTELFLRMLKRLKEACEKNTIVNYWDQDDNLIEGLKPGQLQSIIGLLAKIIKNIEKDPLTIADYVLTQDELSGIAPTLNAIRNPRDSGKTNETPSTKGNEVKQQLQSNNSSTSTSSNDSAIESITGNLLMSMQTVLGGRNNETPTPVAAKTEAPKASRSSSRDKDSVGFAEILDMLKLIHSEMADTKDAVNLLTRRVILIEDKVDKLLAKSNGSSEDQLIFGTRSIGSLPINSRILGRDNNPLI